MTNIDQLINWAYDFFYEKNYKDYKVGSIVTSNIKPKDIKIEGNENLINNIFNSNLEYIKKIGNTHILKRTSGSFSVNIHINSLNSEDINDLHIQDNMNISIAYILNDFLVKGLTKHLLLGILNIDLPIKELNILIEKFPELESFNKKDDYIRISILEHFFKMSTLNQISYNKWSDDDYRVLFFQVLHTLAVIQQKYPGFRHNLLFPKNIYCYEKDKRNKILTKYHFEKIDFNVPNNGIDIKLYNYCNSNIAGIWENKDITEKQKTKNKLFDWLLFLQHFSDDINMKYPTETLKFVQEMLKLNKDSDIVTPASIIINHNYFSSFQNKILNNNIMKNTIQDSDNDMLIGKRTLNFKPNRHIKDEKTYTSESQEDSSSSSSSSSSSDNKLKSKKKRHVESTTESESESETESESIKKSKNKRHNNIETSESESTSENETESESIKKSKNKRHNNIETSELDSDMPSDLDSTEKPKNYSNNEQAGGKKQIKINNLGSALGISRDYLRNVPRNMDPRVRSYENDITSPEAFMPSINHNMAMNMPNVGMSMPNMGMPNMGMPNMGMPMGMPNMGMPNMSMPNMSMPMGMPMGMDMTGMANMANMANMGGMSGMPNASFLGADNYGIDNMQGGTEDINNIDQQFDQPIEYPVDIPQQEGGGDKEEYIFPINDPSFFLNII